jgi:hypothetical protein
MMALFGWAAGQDLHHRIEDLWGINEARVVAGNGEAKQLDGK